MEPSKVFFTNLRVHNGDNLQNKLERLIRKAGIETIDFDGKYTAIKIHFGEPGNLAYLRPNYAKTVADVVKGLGGKPFLTDCNTLYVGGRKNALDHIESAYLNGFSPFSTGCHILIGDGLKGTDDVAVPVKGGEYVKEAKIGRAVMDADIIIWDWLLIWFLPNTASWMKNRRTPRVFSGWRSIPGNMASFCAIRMGRQTLQASSMSPGISAMWAWRLQRRLPRQA